MNVIGARSKVLDASDRHGEGVVREHEFEQGAGSDDRQLRHLFEEVPKRGEGAGSGLYLVQKQDGVLRSRSVGDGLDHVEHGRRIVAGERLGELRMSLEVDGQQVPVGCRFAEQPDQRGLADLPRPAQDQGLASRPMQPLLQILQAMTVHDAMISFTCP